MKIVKYKVELGKNKQPCLVRETVLDCQTGIFCTPESVVAISNAILHTDQLAEEHAYLFTCNIKNKPLGVFEVSHGIADSTFLNPREIFIRLLLVGANRFVLIHNLPSGDCTPSEQDFTATKRLQSCAAMVGISFQDYVIVGDGYYSFYENGKMG